MCTPLDLVTVPQPHFIPGYTGYCPQYIFRAGNTYGSCTHKVLVDPTINHTDHLVLADRTTDDYQVYRPSQKDIDIVKSRFRQGNTVYQHPMVPGYEGFVPRINNQFGQCYSVEATEALSEFEKHQHKNRSALQHVRILGAAQNDSWDPKSLQDRTLIKTNYKLPLASVRPEQVAVIRDRKVVEPSLEPPIQSQSPYFMNNDNPKKTIMKGGGVHVPFGYSKFGASNDPMTNSALCDFTSNYRKKMSTEWAPVSISRPDPPLHFQPMEIYHKHVGLMPNYAGHIPGARFRHDRNTCYYPRTSTLRGIAHCLFYSQVRKDHWGRLEGRKKVAEKRLQVLNYFPHRMKLWVWWTEFQKLSIICFCFHDIFTHNRRFKMSSSVVQESFRRIQAAKSRYPGRVYYGYTHGLGEKTRRTNIHTNEFLNVLRQKQATEWFPRHLSEHPKPFEITCYAIHHSHVGHIPNYGGHIPGAQFRYGRTFGNDTIDPKRWLRGDRRPN